MSGFLAFTLIDAYSRGLILLISWACGRRFGLSGLKFRYLVIGGSPLGAKHVDLVQGDLISF
jgi:hypothetical protein